MAKMGHWGPMVAREQWNSGSAGILWRPISWVLLTFLTPFAYITFQKSNFWGIIFADSSSAIFGLCFRQLERSIFRLADQEINGQMISVHQWQSTSEISRWSDDDWWVRFSCYKIIPMLEEEFQRSQMPHMWKTQPLWWVLAFHLPPWLSNALQEPIKEVFGSISRHCTHSIFLAYSCPYSHNSISLLLLEENVQQPSQAPSDWRSLGGRPPKAISTFSMA